MLWLSESPRGGDSNRLPQHDFMEKLPLFIVLIPTPDFPLCYVRCKSGVTFVWRCFRDMSRVVRKPAFCICENKDADQLRGNREADQRLSFRYTDSVIPLLPKYEISSLLLSSVAAQPGLCRTWSEIRKTGFLTTRLI